jgi:transposase
MEIEAINRRVIGLDIHQAQITACALVEDERGGLRKEHRQFVAFKRDRRALAEWYAAIDPAEIVMESTGIYWKSPYAALEKGKTTTGRPLNNANMPINFN